MIFNSTALNYIRVNVCWSLGTLARGITAVNVILQQAYQGDVLGGTGTPVISRNVT